MVGPLEFYVNGASATPQREQAGKDMHIAVSPLLTRRLHHPIGPHLQNTSPKIIKNFKTVEQGIKSSTGPFRVRAPV